MWCIILIIEYHQNQKTWYQLICWYQHMSQYLKLVVLLTFITCCTAINWNCHCQLLYQVLNIRSAPLKLALKLDIALFHTVWVVFNCVSHDLTVHLTVKDPLVPPFKQPNTNCRTISVSNGDSIKWNYTPPAFFLSWPADFFSHPEITSSSLSAWEPPRGLSGSQRNYRPAFGVENIGPGSGRPLYKCFSQFQDMNKILPEWELITADI